MGLDEEVAALKAELKKISQQKTSPPPTEILYTKERKLTKFDGTTNFSEWEAEVLDDIDGLKSEKSKKLVREALEGKAKREIRLVENAGKTWVDGSEIVNALKSVFGQQKTAAQRTREFSLRKQSKHESVAEFSQDLDKLSIGMTNKDQMMKEQFCDNLYDDQLRWELSRQRRVDPTVTFLVLRQYAIDYENNKPKLRASADSATVDTVDAGLRQEIAQLREEVRRLSLQKNAVESNSRQGQPRPSYSNGQPFQGYCRKCSRWGHKARSCPQSQKSTWPRPDYRLAFGPRPGRVNSNFGHYRTAEQSVNFPLPWQQFYRPAPDQPVTYSSPWQPPYRPSPWQQQYRSPPWQQSNYPAWQPRLPTGVSSDVTQLQSANATEVAGMSLSGPTAYSAIGQESGNA